MTGIAVLTDLLHASAERIPDRVAIESAAGGRSLTYRALFEAAERGAGALHELGLSPGERVLLAIDGSPEWPIGFFSIVRAGLIAVPFPARPPANALAAVAAHAEPRAYVVADANAAISLPGVRCVTTADLDQGVPLATSLARPTDIAVLMFTSGSTAQPRAVELTHGNLLANVRSLLTARHAGPAEALLSVLPPSHVFELVLGQLVPVAAGARIVYAGTPLPNRMIDAMRNLRVTRALLVPALLEALCRDVIGGLVDAGLVEPSSRHLPPADLAECVRACDADRRRRLVDAVRERVGGALHTIAVGGAAMAPRWADVLASFGIGIDVGYGLTEAGPLVSMGLAAECPSGSVGRPVAGVDVRVDERGEILVRGPGVMRGYLKDGVATASVLEQGWLHTGDRGRIDEDGFLYVTGRIKEAIVTAAGDTIYPDEVEPSYASALFAQHCVVPAPGPDGNDLPTLIVVTERPETTDADVQREFARLRSSAPPRHHVAAVVRRTVPLPRTALDKIQRRGLADELRIRTVIGDVTRHDISALRSDDDLVASLGVDSLQRLQILAIVEKRFDVRLPDDELIHLRTIERITRAVDHARVGAL